MEKSVIYKKFQNKTYVSHQGQSATTILAWILYVDTQSGERKVLIQLYIPQKPLVFEPNNA